MVVSAREEIKIGVEIMKKAEMHLTPWWLRIGTCSCLPYAGNLEEVAVLWSTEKPMEK
jgi:hypothetical protein